jgi:hypothetical protein
MKKKKLLIKVKQQKEQIQQLYKDIDTLLDEGHEFEKLVIRFQREFQINLLKSIWGV